MFCFVLFEYFWRLFSFYFLFFWSCLFHFSIFYIFIQYFFFCANGYNFLNWKHQCLILRLPPIWILNFAIFKGRKIHVVLPRLSLDRTQKERKSCLACYQKQFPERTKNELQKEGVSTAQWRFSQDALSI